MQHFNIITRRGFLDRSFKVGLGVALSTLVDIPLVVKRALAEGTIGKNGKKLLFIFLRGANDSDRKSTRLNSSHSQISYAVFCLKKKKIRFPAPAATLTAR